jgi:hypothetical protein
VPKGSEKAHVQAGGMLADGTTFNGHKSLIHEECSCKSVHWREVLTAPLSPHITFPYFLSPKAPFINHSCITMQRHEIQIHTRKVEGEAFRRSGGKAWGIVKAS